MPATKERPGRTARVMIWEDGRAEQVELCWGLRPMVAGHRPISLLRSEGREEIKRCLIIVNDFYLRAGTAPDGKRRRVELVTAAPFFCFAGTWRSELSDWPAAFAGLTVEAYPDIAPYQDRHLAVVHEEDWMDWLTGSRSMRSTLCPFPAGSFRISGPAPGRTADLFGD